MAKKPPKSRSKAARNQSGAVLKKRPKAAVSGGGLAKGLPKHGDDPDIPGVLADMPPEAVRMIATSMRTSSFSGPLPRPSVLKEYNHLIQNGAERIMVMAETKMTMEEREQGVRHRHVELVLSNERLRVHYSVVVGLACIAGAVAACILGKLSSRLYWRLPVLGPW